MHKLLDLLKLERFAKLTLFANSLSCLPYNSPCFDSMLLQSQS